MSVYKRDGFWHFRFMHRGRVVRKSTKQRDKRVAVAMEAAARTALSQGDVGLGEKPVVPTLERFLVDRILPWAAERKPTTATWFRSGITPIIQSKELCKMRLDQLTSEHVDRYTGHRMASGRAVGTVNRELRVLRRSLRLAAKWRILRKEDLPEVSMAGAEVRRDRVVGDAEFAVYISKASPLLRDLAVLLHESGMRPEEAHRLEWRFVSFEHNRMLIPHGKSAAARRQLPLTPNVRQMLERRASELQPLGIPYVFPAATTSQHVEHWTFRKQHAIALKKSGIEPFELYSLRHTFATRIAPRCDAWSLCRIMGWNTLAIAMTYVHASDKQVLEAFNGSSGHEFGHAFLGDGLNTAVGA
jgi:integrase